MPEWGEIAKEIIRRNLGEHWLEEICRQFGLNAADRELLNELISRWRPDYKLEDIIALCEDVKDRPNIDRVMQAWEVVARQAAHISEFRRLGRNN